MAGEAEDFMAAAEVSMAAAVEAFTAVEVTGAEATGKPAHS